MRIVGQQFENVRVHDRPVSFSDLELDRVTFIGCSFAHWKDASFPSVVSRLVARRCRLQGCSVHGIRFEEVTVENLAISSTMYLEACVFRHVTLTGKIGRIMTISPHSSLEPRLHREFRESSEAFYRTVDWAVDISAAQFRDAEFHMVPGEKVRRDPATQFLLRRETFQGLDRRDLPTIVSLHADRFDVTPFDSLVAVVPTLSPRFDKYLAAFEEAKAAGLVE